MTTFARAVAWLRSLLAIPFRFAADRRGRVALAGFDDRSLADLGLTRPDLGRSLARSGQDREAQAQRARRR